MPGPTWLTYPGWEVYAHSWHRPGHLHASHTESLVLQGTRGLSSHCENTIAVSQTLSNQAGVGRRQPDRYEKDVVRNFGAGLTTETSCRPSQKRMGFRQMSGKCIRRLHADVELSRGVSWCLPLRIPCSGATSAPASGADLVTYMSNSVCNHCYHIAGHIWLTAYPLCR